MAGFKTEGIILKRRNFGEADRILTVFSLHKGKISVMAKGVRKITSRRSGNVELLNRVSMFLYPGKQFLILTEATSLDTFPKLKEDLTLSTYAYHLIELIDKMTAENQENRILYGHLVEVLKGLSNKPRQILIRAFETKILSNLGFFSFKSLGVNVIHPPGGPAPKERRVASHTRILLENLLEKLETGTWEEIEKMEIKQKEALELERVLRYHLERVIETPLKSRQFLKEIK